MTFNFEISYAFLSLVSTFMEMNSNCKAVMLITMLDNSKVGVEIFDLIKFENDEYNSLIACFTIEKQFIGNLPLDSYLNLYCDKNVFKITPR